MILQRIHFLIAICSEISLFGTGSYKSLWKFDESCPHNAKFAYNCKELINLLKLINGPHRSP